MRKIILLVLGVALIGIASAFGSGIQNFFLSARASTLGGAFVARADDVSAVYYNPAGIVYLDRVKFNTQFLYSYLTTTAEYGPSSIKIRSNPGQLLGSFYVTWKINDRLSLGAGGFVPYAEKTSWPADWEGGNLNVTSKLRSFYIRPVLAFKISEKLSVGAGLDFVFTKVEWSHNLLFSPRIYGVPLDKIVISNYNLEGNGLGFVASFLYKPNNKFRIGGKYQHKVNINLNGLNDFDRLYTWDADVPSPLGFPLPLKEIFSDFYKTQEVTSKITMPCEVALGLLYAPNNKLTFQFDLHWTKWSDVKNWEFTSINSPEQISKGFIDQYGDYYGITPDYAKQGISLSWKDTWSLNFGVEYLFNKYISIGTGFAHIQSPVENFDFSPIHPYLNRNILSFGFGYDGPFFSQYDGTEIGWLSFDIFFQYQLSSNKMTTLFDSPISYGGNRLAIGIGIGFNL